MAVKFFTCTFQSNARKLLTKSLRVSHSVISECENLHLSLQVVICLIFVLLAALVRGILKLIREEMSGKQRETSY